MNNYFIGGVIGVILIGAGLGYTFIVKSPTIHTTIFPTFFTYSEGELAPLTKLSSDQTITLDALRRSDETMYRLLAKNSQNPLFHEDPSKIYAYLMMAERDFTLISKMVSGKLSGNIEHLTKRTLCIFFTDDCDSIIVGEEDVYSKSITDIVILKLRERMAQEKMGQESFPLRSEDTYWQGPQPSVGITSASNKGWFIQKGDQFRVAPPPAYDSKEFQDEVNTALNELKNATSEHKMATVFWAGGPGTKMLPGIFLEKAMSKMSEKEVTLEKVVYIRSILAATIDDANTAVFDSKYAHQVKRPFMMDSSIVTIMPTPNHPSYPSGHSTLSLAAAQILGYFFPEDKAYWDAQAEESGMSRVWGGIHYLMDHAAGKKLGNDVASHVLEAVSLETSH